MNSINDEEDEDDDDDDDDGEMTMVSGEEKTTRKNLHSSNIDRISLHSSMKRMSFFYICL